MTPRPRLLCLHAEIEDGWRFHGQDYSMLVLVTGKEHPTPAWRPNYVRMRLKTDLEDTLGCKVHYVIPGGGDRP